MSANVLVTKGSKRVSGRSSNKKASDNIISNGSVIAVNEGQTCTCGTVNKGKICPECGDRFDSSDIQ